MIEFGRLSDMVKNAAALDSSEAVASAMERDTTQFYILELNRRRQLFFRGIDATGKLLSDIGGPYTLYTLREKEGTRPNNRANLINLFDTGEFYDSFNMILEKDGFLIIADTMKEGEDLQDRWGDEILGLTDESKELTAQKITPDVVEYTGGKLLG